ncbi:hypothetical protein CSUI_001847 [Cystoisospora suis]|uniref:Uncharacterized protein n=1 Tax=Cystoisospora suis TaxID=483139 RepID=A0A2C6LAZ6_9APIC|nr:hypothetical protein CSUI_001847 [Cystoisospora suis]
MKEQRNKPKQATQKKIRQIRKEKDIVMTKEYSDDKEETSRERMKDKKRKKKTDKKQQREKKEKLKVDSEVLTGEHERRSNFLELFFDGDFGAELAFSSASFDEDSSGSFGEEEEASPSSCSLEKEKTGGEDAGGGIAIFLSTKGEGVLEGKKRGSFSLLRETKTGGGGEEEGAGEKEKEEEAGGKLGCAAFSDGREMRRESRGDKTEERSLENPRRYLRKEEGLPSSSSSS